jgi:hypothetical protein
MCAPRVTRHTSIWYSSSCHTRVSMGASIFFTAAKIRAFRHPCWRVCGKNLNIVSTCDVSPLVHTSNISICQKTFFSFPVAVNNSIKVGPLVFLVKMFVITENIMKHPVLWYKHNIWMRGINWCATFSRADLNQKISRLIFCQILFP